MLSSRLVGIQNDCFPVGFGPKF